MHGVDIALRARIALDRPVERASFRSRIERPGTDAKLARCRLALLIGTSAQSLGGHAAFELELGEHRAFRLGGLRRFLPPIIARHILAALAGRGAHKLILVRKIVATII